MTRSTRWLALAAAVLVASPAGYAAEAPVNVTSVIVVTAPPEVRVVIEATAPVRFELQSVRPDWIVVDVMDAQLDMPAGTLPAATGPILRIRAGQFTSTVVRVVVELTRALPYRVISSSPSAAIVVSISNRRAEAAAGAPAAASREADAVLIVPGRTIGRAGLGMRIQDVLNALGPARHVTQLPGVGADYIWYEPAAPAGLGVQVTNAGIVRRIWVINDDTYHTREGLRTGSTETAVRKTLGRPSWSVRVTAAEQTEALMYDTLGVWFGVRADNGDASRQVVFRIDVVAPGTSGSGAAPTP